MSHLMRLIVFIPNLDRGFNMSYKKFLFGATAFATLLAPMFSFAAPMPGGPTAEKNSGFYAKIQYNGDFWNNIGTLKDRKSVV